MGIDFQCQHCRKKVNAPDSAAGKRGKCPFCGQSNYIPTPLTEDDVLPLAPLDEEEERQRRAKLSDLYRQEEALLSESKTQLRITLPLNLTLHNLVLSSLTVENTKFLIQPNMTADNGTIEISGFVGTGRLTSEGLELDGNVSRIRTTIGDLRWELS